MRRKTARLRLLEINDKIFELRKVKVLIGKHKKPIDAPDEIIFHIDI